MRTLARGRAALWTKDKINSLTTPDVRNLRANAERLLETEIAALCNEVLGERPRGGATPSAKPKTASRARQPRVKAEVAG